MVMGASQGMSINCINYLSFHWILYDRVILYVPFELA